MTSRIMALRRARIFVAALALSMIGILGFSAPQADAHLWGNWHWNKTGSQIVLYHWIYGGHTAEAGAARQDGWNKISILYNYTATSHTDISVFDANSGNTGWIGLASLESVSGDHITHAHAQYNTYYGASSLYIQGVYCQEIFHTYGFDHSNTGDCMGLGYYSSTTYYYGSHNSSDFYNRYRYH